MSKRKTQEEFEKEVKEKLNDEYVVLGEYINNRTNIKVLHKLCGEIKYVKPNHLLNGHGCKKCGIKKFSESRIKTDTKFKKELYEKYNGEYIANEKYKGDKEKINITHTKCNNSWEIAPNTILHNHGCPFCNSSRGETKIKIWLDKHKIKYEPQKNYSNLRGVGGGLLSYDFYLPDYNMLIEMQGEQHVRQREIFGGIEQFNIQKEHDDRKREYAKANNVELLEIWYFDFKNIEKILESRLLLQSA